MAVNQAILKLLSQALWNSQLLVKYEIFTLHVQMQKKTAVLLYRSSAKQCKSQEQIYIFKQTESRRHFPHWQLWVFLSGQPNQTLSTASWKKTKKNKSRFWLNSSCCGRYEQNSTCAWMLSVNTWRVFAGNSKQAVAVKFKGEGKKKKSICQRLFRWLSDVGMRRTFWLCVFSLEGIKRWKQKGGRRETRGMGKPWHSVCTEEQSGFTVTQWTVGSLEVCLRTKLYTYWSGWWSKSRGSEAEGRERQSAVGGMITHSLTAWLEY